MTMRAPGEVPSDFAPSVTEGAIPMSPASAPGVIPMRNAAPGQMQQFGDTLTQQGDFEAKLGNTIADRIQETMDAAATKDAENQFLSTALPALGKYKTTEGINAVNQFDSSAQAIVKAKDDIGTGLTPIQKRAFDMAASGHITTMVAQMHYHRDVQEVQYGKDQSSSRVQLLNGQARMTYLDGDMAGYLKYSQDSTDEVEYLAKLSGILPGSARAQDMLQKNQGDLAHGVISGLLERHAVDEADEYFSNVQGHIDSHTAGLLDGAIKTAHMQEDPKNDIQRAAMAVKGITGPGVLQPLITAGTISTTDGVDGIDIHASAGTKVLAPASGNVTKVGFDPKKGNIAEIALQNGYTAIVSGLSAVNYAEGQKITQGQVLGHSGRDDSGQGVTHYAMTGPDGKFIDPRSASSSPLDPKSINSAQDEEKGVDYLNANIADPYERNNAVTLWRRTVSGNREIINQENMAAYKDAMNYAVQHNSSIYGLPEATRSLLTPVQIDSFNQQAKAHNDVSLMMNWAEHPEQQTVNAVKLAWQQGRLSDSYAPVAMRQAMSLQGQDENSTNPVKVRAVTVDHDQLSDILSLNQFPHLAQPETAGTPVAKAAAQLQRVQLETAIKNEIDLQQTNLKRELNWQEKQKIMRDMIVDKVYTSGNSTNDLKPASILTQAEQDVAHVWVGPKGNQQKVRMMDIPRLYTVQAMQDLQANGLPSTQANIAAWWLRKGKPTQ
jgi:hypothetical protein